MVVSSYLLYLGRAQKGRVFVMNEIQLSTFTWLWIIGLSGAIGVILGYMLGLWENHIVKKAIEEAKKEEIQYG